MVDPTLHGVAERASTQMKQIMRWLVHQDVKVDNEDAAMYALLVRAAILAAADRGELVDLGVINGRQISELRVNHHVHTDDCGHGEPAGNINLEFIWDDTPMIFFCNLPDPKDN